MIPILEETGTADKLNGEVTEVTRSVYRNVLLEYRLPGFKGNRRDFGNDHLTMNLIRFMVRYDVDQHPASQDASVALRQASEGGRNHRAMRAQQADCGNPAHPEHA
jgi:hypothetical protein